MTDAPIPTTLPAAQPPARNGLKIALAVSVALNLAVVGMIAGAWIKGGGHGRGMPHEMSFGPFSEALGPEDRSAIRRALLDHAKDFRTNSQEAKAEFQTLLLALRASPFDPAAMQSALAAIETRTAGRLALGRSLIENRIVEMSETDRLAFADRLENGLNRKKRE